MRAIFSPLTAIMRRLKYGEKLAVLALVLGVPALCLLGAFFRDLHHARVTAELELSGNRYVDALGTLLTNLQHHRAVATATRDGRAAPGEQFAAQREVDAAISEIDALPGAADLGPDTAQSWSIVKRDWRALRGRVPRLGSRDLISQHATLISGVLGQMRQVGAASQLLLDSARGSHGLAHVLVDGLPAHSEHLAELRSWALHAAARIRRGTRDRFRLTDLDGIVKVELEGLEQDFARTFAEDQKLQARLGPAVRSSLAQTRGFLLLLRERLASPGLERATVAEIQKTGDTASTLLHQLYDRTTAALDQELQTRIRRVHDQEVVTASAAALTAVVAICLFAGLYLGFADGIANLDRALHRGADADVDRSVEYAARPRDELLVASLTLAQRSKESESNIRYDPPREHPPAQVVGAAEPQTNPQAGPRASAHPGPALDRESLRTRVGEDPEALLDLVTRFQAESRKVLQDLRVGMTRGDANSLERGAHRLTGSLRSVAATAACAAALRLEAAARIGDLGQARDVMNTLEKEMDRLQPEITALGSREVS